MLIEMDSRSNRLQILLPLLLLAAFSLSIFVIVRQTGLQIEDIRSFAKNAKNAKKNKKPTTASQAYADNLIAQREMSGDCVGAACLADVVARSAKENPDYYNSLKGSAKGSVGANTLAVLEMTKIATHEIKTSDPDAQNAVDYCNAHGGSNCSDPKQMAQFLATSNKDLYDIYTTVTAPNGTQISGTVTPEYTSCIKDGSTPSECAGLLRSTTTVSGTVPFEYTSCIKDGGTPSECAGLLKLTAPASSPAPSPVPAPSAAPGAVPLTNPSPVSVNPGAVQPIPSSYYSQVDPGWADQIIPGQSYKFVQAGCGEVAVANILTHAGIPTNPNQAAALIKKDPQGYGTAYGDNIAALTQKGFRADQYPGSFKNLTNYMGPNDVVWLSVRANNATYHDMGHHTYIDGYTMVGGKPVYNLRDPFFGNDMKCGADGDRGLACSAPGRSVHLDAPPDTNNTGEGTVAVILTPPGQ